MRSLFPVFLTICLTLSGCTRQAEKQEAKPAAEEIGAPTIKPGEMVLIPAGEFTMGSNELPKDVDYPYSSYPEHKKHLPAFYIDKYEVTNAEFLKFCVATGYVSEAAKEGKDWRVFFGPGQENYPALNLTYDDAVAYAKWAGKRLPTEEEWEKAARGTDGRRYPWGNEWKGGMANTYESGLKRVRDIGAFAGDESPYGVRDMLGNVQEWTSSWYKPYPGNKHPNPNFGQKFRVVRGLSYAMYGKFGSLWVRSMYVPNALYSIGLRCAKDVEKPGEVQKPEKKAEKPIRTWRQALAILASVLDRRGLFRELGV